MSDAFLAHGASALPQQYAPSLQAAYAEISGENPDRFRESLASFFDAGGDEAASAAQRRLLIEIRSGRAPVAAAEAAYRRFLDRGANSPEGTPGRTRSNQATSPHPLDDSVARRLLDGSMTVMGMLTIGTARPSDPKHAPSPLGLFAETPSISTEGVPQLARLGDTALWDGAFHLFRDVVDLPTPPESLVRRITAVRNDPYSVRLYADEAYLGNASMVDGYRAQLGALDDTATYVAAWNDFVELFLTQFLVLHRFFSKRTEEARRGEFPSWSDVRHTMAPFESAFRGHLGFILASDSPFSATWEFAFVSTQIARLNNLSAAFFSNARFFQTGEVDDTLLPDMTNIAATALDPFDHLHHSFAISVDVQQWLRVDLPSPRPSIFPAWPLALRRIIDEIVDQAGRLSDGKGPAGHLKLTWDADIRRMSFVDAGDEIRALQAFSDLDGAPARLIARLASSLGPEGSLRIVPDPQTGHAARIDIVVPLTDPSPAGSGHIGGTPQAGSSMPSSTNSLGGIVDLSGTGEGAAPASLREDLPVSGITIFSDPLLPGVASLTTLSSPFPVVASGAANVTPVPY